MMQVDAGTKIKNSTKAKSRIAVAQGNASRLVFMKMVAEEADMVTAP